MQKIIIGLKKLKAKILKRERKNNNNNKGILLRTAKAQRRGRGLQQQ